MASPTAWRHFWVPTRMGAKVTFYRPFLDITLFLEAMNFDGILITNKEAVFSPLLGALPRLRSALLGSLTILFSSLQLGTFCLYSNIDQLLVRNVDLTENENFPDVLCDPYGPVSEQAQGSTLPVSKTSPGFATD